VPYIKDAWLPELSETQISGSSIAVYRPHFCNKRNNGYMSQLTIDLSILNFSWKNTDLTKLNLVIEKESVITLFLCHIIKKYRPQLFDILHDSYTANALKLNIKIRENCIAGPWTCTIVALGPSSLHFAFASPSTCHRLHWCPILPFADGST